jgi:flagellar hook assembly protein FlgD
LLQNFPNPFNPATTIKYWLPTRQHVTLSIFDMWGRRVNTIVQETQQAGEHTAAWDGSDSYGGAVASGVYLCRLWSSESNVVTRLVLLR